MNDVTLSTKLRVSVGDTESKHGTNWNDDYGLYIQPEIPVSVHRTYEKPNTGPRTTLFRSEKMQLNGVPERIADVFDVYVDADSHGLSTSGSTAPELEKEEAVITVTVENDNTGEKIHYSVTIYSRQYGRVKINGDRARLSDVPPEVKREADQFIPNDIEFLEGSW